MKYLAVFDFDHTILNDNSDTAILSLVDKDEIPREIKNIQFTQGWTAFMQGIFNYMYEKCVKPENIEDIIKNLPEVSGMIHLIKELTKLSSYDLIMISDSNSIFIKIWLKQHNLETSFMKVFTNPAEIVNGMYKISPYHNQDTCKLSTKNLCKGQILEEFINDQEKRGVVYDHVVYIGDGVNDFCPVLRLKGDDLACARNNFKMWELINKAKNGESFDNSVKPHTISAEVFVWDNGEDIWKELKTRKLTH